MEKNGKIEDLILHTNGLKINISIEKENKELERVYSEPLFMVEVDTKSLNIRNYPNLGGDILDKVRFGTILDIYDVEWDGDNLVWGRIHNNTNEWICLNYCNKINFEWEKLD